MKIVEKATQPPAKCIVTSDIDGPFIDTGAWAGEVDPYIYLHVPLVEQMARDLLGMVPEEEVASLREAVEHLSDIVEDQRKRLEAYEVLEEARKVVAA
mgnify:CR=1 FL=1